MAVLNFASILSEVRRILAKFVEDRVTMLTTARRLWVFAIDHSLLLLVGALVGLVWANVDLHSYDRLVHIIHFVVNDIGMAFFFAIAATEVVEATAPHGALHAPRRAAMPLLAAVGGMAGPALIFVGLAVATTRRNLLPGWAISCATDIAFSYLVARLIFGQKHPAIPFLLLLTIADDVLGLAILAVFYPTWSTENFCPTAGLSRRCPVRGKERDQPHRGSCSQPS